MWFKKVAKEQPKESRPWKQLLRANLDTIAVDVFSYDDPIISLSQEERSLYLKKFHDLAKDKDVMGRLKYLVNLQARLTLTGTKDNSEADVAGAYNLNGMCVVKEDIERLATMFDKENLPPEEFNKFEVI
jgi:hypothetical protein